MPRPRRSNARDVHPLAWALVGLWAASAPAQRAPDPAHNPQPAPADASPADAAPLAGPRVDPPARAAGDDRMSAMDAVADAADAAARRAASLVRITFDGKLEPLDRPVALAALDLIDLDEATRQAVQALIDERGLLVETIIRDNVPLLASLETVFTAGTAADKLQTAIDSLQALKPLTDWGKLDVRLAERMPQDAARAYRAAVREYRRAYAEQAVRAGAAKNKIEASITLYLQDLGREIELAAARIFVEPERDMLAELTITLKLSPDQAAKIRAIYEDLYLRTGGRISPEQERETLNKALAELSGWQKAHLGWLFITGQLEEDSEME